MKITLTDAGKRFNRDWIFRHLSYEFSPHHHYAITGPNGGTKLIGNTETWAKTVTPNPTTTTPPVD